MGLLLPWQPYIKMSLCYSVVNYTHVHDLKFCYYDNLLMVQAK